MTDRTKTIHLQPLKQLGALLVGALVLTSLMMNLEFNLFEANLYDTRMIRTFQPTPSSDIILVTLDEATTKGLDEISPLPPQYHLQFLKMLENQEVRAIGYLLDLNQVNQAYSDQRLGSWANSFLSQVERLKKGGTQFILGTPYDVTGEVVPPFPLSTLSHGIAVIHKDGNVFAEDKITRRALLEIEQQPVFHLELARSLQQTPQLNGTFLIPETEAKYFFFRYHGDPSISGSSSYKRISYIDILQGKVSKDQLKGKILLVGSISKNDSTDFAYTPYSTKQFKTPKLAIHANILDSIMKGESISQAPKSVNAMITLLVTFSVLWAVLNSTPLTGLIASLGLMTCILLISHALFQLEGVWIRESQPLVGAFLAYYLSVPYRLIREYQKRWDYQRKNEILVQVEEMKTNFVYLVTHDLKTPVARIQGLAEMLLRRSKGNLSTEEEKVMGSIIHSTEELNHFINSILELTKLESNQLKLHKTSKDINQLIEKSARTFEAQARAKSVEIQTELDPLFPIYVDVGLLSKVFNNLIDNAIKYSPSESKVKIRSKEENNWIEISVQDEGIGLSKEEMTNLFTRFYRAKNDSNTQVSGTGLGLYLTKYFVEAHGGKVTVESVPQQGSTFKIQLPIQEETSHA